MSLSERMMLLQRRSTRLDESGMTCITFESMEIGNLGEFAEWGDAFENRSE